MTLKRIILSILTLIVVLLMGGSLISSIRQPQVGNQLQLYQTDLLVQASEWDGSGLPEDEVQQFRQAAFGKDALESAIGQYQEVRTASATGLARLQQRMATLQLTSDEQIQQIAASVKQQQQLINQIDLQSGMVWAQQGKVSKAVETWQKLAASTSQKLSMVDKATSITAATLVDLWQDPPTVRPETAAILNDNLKGWFRYRALEQLYAVENQPEQLIQLQATEREVAERTLIKLSITSILPSLGGLLGTAGLIALIGQRLLRGKASILAVPEGQWEVPWNWEVIWQVIVGGFLFVGQVVLPLLGQVVLPLIARPGLTPAVGAATLPTSGFAFMASFADLALTSRGKAIYSLIFYLLMAAATLGVLYGSIRTYLPLSKEWFRVKLVDKWPLWGFGSYLIALPLMLGVSLLNQQIWQGQGGNNPLLQLVLEERDPLSLGLFLFTAAVAAPVFEEILFRGFLLPSLTRYMPIWGAIGLSSLIFSVAHLSFSEVLPLTVLGAILGFAYVRSRNLLSSILLHSAWNSVTMIGLFVLGSGGS
ncbi:MAG: type II CAAX endopeptidase family protein [Phormidesmis sp.]